MLETSATVGLLLICAAKVRIPQRVVYRVVNSPVTQCLACDIWWNEHEQIETSFLLILSTKKKKKKKKKTTLISLPQQIWGEFFKKKPESKKRKKKKKKSTFGSPPPPSLGRCFKTIPREEKESVSHTISHLSKFDTGQNVASRVSWEQKVVWDNLLWWFKVH